MNKSDGGTPSAARTSSPGGRAGWFCLALGASLLAGRPLELRAAPPPSAPRSSGLVWRSDRQHLTARIASQPLAAVLQDLAAVTGWQVLVEPRLDRRVTVQFEALAPAAALRQLLGDLNYALLPRTNSPARLFVFRESVSDATLLIEPDTAARRSDGRIPNELIVTLRPGSGADIDALARRLGGRVLGRLDELGAGRLAFDSDEAAEAARQFFEENPDVASAESNYSVAPPSRMDPLSLSSLAPLNLKVKPVADGQGTVIGLIDTAVQRQGTALADFLLPEISLLGAAQAAPSYPTHGTAMAETILRAVALDPQSAQGTAVRILPVDVYGAQETANTFDVARGICAAVEQGARIINLSLGGEGDSGLLRQVIQEAHQQGVMFIAAAGNAPGVDPTYPAAYSEVVAATAGDRRGQVASYANSGPFVDVIAPGGAFVSFLSQSFMITGTSAATAHVTGLAANAAATTAKPLAEIETAIRQSLAFQPAVSTRPP